MINKEGVTVEFPGDDELIAKTLAGESAAFGILMRKHQGIIYDLALRMLGTKEEAEDVIQQVFVEAFRHLAGFRHGSQFSTWLYAIALNRGRNHLRSRKTRHSVALDDITAEKEDGRTPFQLADKTAGPEQLLERQLDLEWIRKEVKMLPKDFQEIFTLHYFHDLSLQEVASRLGRPLGTIKVYLHRARKELLQRSLKRMKK